MMNMYDDMAQAHPSLSLGQVWCRQCRSTRRVDSAGALRNGWPKCCGYTMTIDHPDTWSSPSVERTPENCDKDTPE